MSVPNPPPKPKLILNQDLKVTISWNSSNDQRLPVTAYYVYLITSNNN